MAKRAYSEETKAAAMAALLQGQSVSSIAKEYKIPKGTVSGWKKQAQHQADGVADKATQKKEIIGNLIIEYLEANLRAVRAQTILFSNQRWLMKQRADEVAVLHGVLIDKSVRLLEAFARDDSDTPAEG